MTNFYKKLYRCERQNMTHSFAITKNVKHSNDTYMWQVSSYLRGLVEIAMKEHTKENRYGPTL